MANRITGREKQILGLVCEGLTNKEIAHELDRSIHTISNHLKKIFAKLDVKDRFEAIALVKKNGFLD